MNYFGWSFFTFAVAALVVGILLGLQVLAPKVSRVFSDIGANLPAAVLILFALGLLIYACFVKRS